LEAVGYFDRALELHRESDTTAHASSRTWSGFLNPLSGIDSDGKPFRLATPEGGLSEAHYPPGNITQSRAHAERALAHLGHPIPEGRAHWFAATAVEAVRRNVQALWLRSTSAEPRALEVARAATGIQLQLTETYVYSLRAGPAVWSML